MERLDYLLDLTLARGELPIEATPAEREELLAMLASMSLLRAAAEDAAVDARASLPIARARFERFLDAQGRPGPASAPIPVTHSTRKGLFRGAGRPRTIGFALAGLVLVALAAFAGSRLFFASATTAEALTPGDYVQLQGTISSATDVDGMRVLKVASELGEITIDASLATPIVAADGATVATLQPGQSVVVGGLVKEKRRVAAQSLALAESAHAAPRKITFKELKDRRPELSGRVVVLTLSADGLHGRVLIETASGERLLVTVDAQSAGRLLELTRALGAHVQVAGGSAPHQFSLDVAPEPDPSPTTEAAATTTAPPSRDTSAPRPTHTPPPTKSPSAGERPALPTLRGVVQARQGNRLVIRTADGQKTVIIRAGTHILIGESGILVDAFRTGEVSAVGHQVSVTGAADAADNVIADVIVLGPKTPAPAR